MTQSCVDAAVTQARLRTFLVACLLIVHGAMLGWTANQDAPTLEEVDYLAAGLSHWQFGRFEMASVSPPLVRLVAAIPVLLAHPKYDWHSYNTDVQSRSEHEVGSDFVAANGPRTFFFFTLARLACIPLSLLGGLICYRWAWDLYGWWAGLLSLLLWCFSPAVLGQGHVMGPDLGVTSLGLAASYLFWRWLKSPGWASCAWAGLALGLAELAKTNVVVFFPLWPILWAVYRIGDRRARRTADVGRADFGEPSRVASLPFPDGAHVSARQASSLPYVSEARPMSRWRSEVAQLGAMLFLGLYVINLGYGCEGSFRKLGTYKFQSRLLTGGNDNTNRFADSFLGQLPVPLPSSYVLGFDIQKSDFENSEGRRTSYFRGKWYDHGWWWYYLFVVAVKTPVGAIGLFILALLWRARSGWKSDWRDEIVLLAPGVALFALASSQTGFSHHPRYALPALPYALIWTSQAAAIPVRLRPIWRGVARWAVGLLAAWSLASSAWIWPHSLAYFNELVGGPLGGGYYLQSSSIDWGEDLLYLKRWIDSHPEARPLYVAYWGAVDARIARIDFPPPNVSNRRRSDTMVPQPGWYAISQKCLRGDDRFGPAGCEVFLNLKPVDHVGYSIFIYHVDAAGRQAERTRQ
jgi:4-amino-4-deoxy-L-arabinose transferase-like glycosyltransferase